MDPYLTPQNITFILGILAIIFSVYNYFRNPQIKSDKTDALLAQRVQWDKEMSEKRLSDLGLRLDASTTLAQNHIHTVDVKVDNLTNVVNSMNTQLTNEITKLSTIINERIPNRKEG